MWRGTDPVTGQARVAGTKERPAMSASFNDSDGKPFVFQLARDQWKEAMTSLGFYDRITEAGFGHLGVAMESDAKREEVLALLGRLFATGSREEWVSKLRAGDIVSAPINTMLEAAVDPDVVANGYVAEMDYPEHGKRLKVHGTPWKFSETPAKIGVAPKLGEHNDEVLTSLGYSQADIAGFRERKAI